jgi:hypothetical protein
MTERATQPDYLEVEVSDGCIDLDAGVIVAGSSWYRSTTKRRTAARALTADAGSWG